MTSERAERIPPFIVMDVLEKAEEMSRQGRAVVHLEVGEPDFDTPECVKQAGIEAIRDGRTHYTHSLGLRELREAICQHYRDEYGVRIVPEQVLVTSGTSPAMFLLFAALLDRGDEVIISDPRYACYPNFIEFLGGRPVSVPVSEEDGFQFRPEEIRRRITPRTKAIFVNSPANPTGNILSAERMAAIAGLGVPVISDEIYHGLVYGGDRAGSILEHTDRAFVLNGFSKKYAMTGWRLGYVIAPPEFIRPMQKVQQNFFISASSFVQWGGVAALRRAAPDVARMVAVYDERRCFMIKRLREIGFGITVEPTGAFYVLANARFLGEDSYKMAFHILEEIGVAVSPGIDFGPGAEGYLRFSYATSIDNIAEGLGRIESYVARHRS